MTKLEITKKTFEEALGYEIAQAKKEGLVVEIDTKDGEYFGVLIEERKAEQADEPYFSLSQEAVLTARACKCEFVANIFGQKCAIIAVDAPDIESRDEWNCIVHTYANPLCDE